MVGSFAHDPGSDSAGVLRVPQLNVSAKRIIEHVTGFSLSAWSIGHGLFDTDDLTALRALAEAMTSAIHYPSVQANPRQSILGFSCPSVSHRPGYFRSQLSAYSLPPSTPEPFPPGQSEYRLVVSSFRGRAVRQAPVTLTGVGALSFCAKSDTT